MNKLCFIYESESGSTVSLTQKGQDSFTVRYDQQVQPRLKYADAAMQLGAAIMHSAACDGILENG